MSDPTTLSRALSLLLLLYIVIMTLIGVMLILNTISGEDQFAPPHKQALAIADMLQHVDKQKDERCPICHDDEPTAPVRLSCKHLFCCSCAYKTLLQRQDCPLCLRKPAPLGEHLSVQSTSSAESDARVRRDILVYTIGVLPAVFLFYFGDNALVIHDLLCLQCLLWMLHVLTATIALLIDWPRKGSARVVGQN